MARKHATRLSMLAACCVVATPGLVACPDPTPLPSAQALYSDGRCDNEGGVVEDESRRQEGSLTGDLDGDGSDDEVYIVADPGAEPGCKSFLVIDAGPSRYSEPIDLSGTPRSLEVPTLNSLSEVNDQPGTEVVVNVEMGASTQFVSVFTFGGQSVQQIEIRGKAPGPFAGELGELFPFGGSVGHLEAVDCLDGYVVMSAALPKGDSADAYEVDRRFFAAEGNELILDREQTEKVTVEGLKIDDFPEFGGSPFLSCD